MTAFALCSVAGCSNRVQKPGHTLCLLHWRARGHTVEEPAASHEAVSPSAASSQNVSDTHLNSTALGEPFNLKPEQVNRVLFDLGWVERSGKGWKPTALGEKLKAQPNIHTKTGVPFVRWLKDISKSRILKNAINEFLAVEVAPPNIQTAAMPEEAADKIEGFREKFPPTIRASDGHMVRSRAEAMIDGWLYENRIVHAYERLVRVEQKMYSDFYLPEFDLYIEFWGLENDPKYKARKEKKLQIYRQNELRLVEIKDEQVANLDDYLIAQLVKFGYNAK